MLAIIYIIFLGDFLPSKCQAVSPTFRAIACAGRVIPLGLTFSPLLTLGVCQGFNVIETKANYLKELIA